MSKMALKERQHCCSKISQKNIFIFMSFLSMVYAFAVRMCLPMTITEMVVKVNKTETFYIDDTCASPGVSRDSNGKQTQINSALVDQPKYLWDEHTQGLILSSFYWGYILTHVPGGLIAERFGGKYTLGIGIVLPALGTLITPAAIAWGGSTFLIILQAFTGLCEGVTQPAMSVLLSQWVPAEERSKVSSIVYLGATAGILLVTTSHSPLIHYFGWPSVFYFTGVTSGIWFIFWIFLCYNSPRSHPFISRREADNLISKLEAHTHTDPPPVPWRHLLSSAPFWALVSGTIGRDWSGYILMADLPKYTTSVLKFTNEDNSKMFLLTHISIAVYTLLISWLSDWLIEQGHASRTMVRKVNSTLSIAANNAVILLGTYIGCNKYAFYAVLVTGSLFAAHGFPGIKANALDLSPNYAGTVMAISHGIAGLCGVFGPYVVGLLITNQTLREWRNVFWIIFGVGVVTSVIYAGFASGEVQEWNDPNFDRKKKKKQRLTETQIAEAESMLMRHKIEIVAAEVIRSEISLAAESKK